MQLNPVRWNFIKSPTTRKPYKLIRKLLEKELANTKSNTLSDLDNNQMIEIREKTKKNITHKIKKEYYERLITIGIILLISVTIVYFIILK